jgi:peptide-methionine (S)-S-oxide reductase
MAVSGMLDPMQVAPDAFPDPEFDPLQDQDQATAVIAGGCFWCTEAVFKSLDGVESVRSGYVGGSAETADYRTVCSGTTDHAEAIEIVYDPRRTSFGQILKIFFSVAHDPTQLNRQGNDVGRQYRSAIFVMDDHQKKVAEAYIAQLNAAGVFAQPIVTTLEPFVAFYEAEDYHQDYAAQNPMQPYIMHVSQPKVEKFKHYYGDKLKR